MPEKRTIDETLNSFDFTQLRMLRTIPVEPILPGKIVLRCDLYERVPTIRDEEVRFTHLASNGLHISLELQERLAYLLEQELLYERLDDLGEALAVASSHVTARDVYNRMVRKGGLFLGVALWDCPEEIRDRAMGILKSALITKINFDGGNRVAVKPRDLSSTFFDEEDFMRCSAYRGAYPNSVFLFYDPHSVLRSEGFRSRVYGINLRALVPYKGLPSIPVL